MSLSKKHITSSLIQNGKLVAAGDPVVEQDVNYYLSSDTSVSVVITRHFEDFLKKFYQPITSSGFITSQNGNTIDITAGDASASGRWLQTSNVVNFDPVTSGLGDDVYYIVVSADNIAEGSEFVRSPGVDSTLFEAILAGVFDPQVHLLLGKMTVTTGAISAYEDHGAKRITLADHISPYSSDEINFYTGTYPNMTIAMSINSDQSTSFYGDVDVTGDVTFNTGDFILGGSNVKLEITDGYLWVGSSGMTGGGTTDGYIYVERGAEFNTSKGVWDFIIHSDNITDIFKIDATNDKILFNGNITHGGANNLTYDWSTTGGYTGQMYFNYNSQDTWGLVVNNLQILKFKYSGELLEIGWRTNNIVSILGNLDVGAGIDVIGGVVVRDTIADSTNKLGRFYTEHYLNAEENFLGFDIRGLVSTNEINYGGGSATYNAATRHSFYAAANNTTVTGTEVFRIFNTVIDSLVNHNFDAGIDVTGQTNFAGGTSYNVDSSGNLSIRNISFAGGLDWVITNNGTHTYYGVSTSKLHYFQVQSVTKFQIGSTITSLVNHDFEAGIDVTGGDITIVDNNKIYLGTSNDLEIYHNGTHSYIDNNTGTLVLTSPSDIDMITGNIVHKLSGQYVIKDLDDSNAVIYDFNTTARTLDIGNVDDLVVTDFWGNVNFSAGIDVTGVITIDTTGQRAIIVDLVDPEIRDFFFREGSDGYGGKLRYDGADNTFELLTIDNTTEYDGIKIPRAGGSIVMVRNTNFLAGIDVTGEITSTDTITTSITGAGGHDDWLVFNHGGNDNWRWYGDDGNNTLVLGTTNLNPILTIARAGVTTFAANVNFDAGIDVTGSVASTFRSTNGNTNGRLNVGAYSWLSAEYSSQSTMLGFNAYSDTGLNARQIVALTHGTAGYNFIEMGIAGIKFHSFQGSVTAGNEATDNEMMSITDDTITSFVNHDFSAGIDIDGGDITIASGYRITSADEDLAFTFGRAYIGDLDGMSSDWAGFGHRDGGDLGYAILQGSLGQTYINAASGQTTRFNINNSLVFSYDASVVDFLTPISFPDGTSGEGFIQGNYTGHSLNEFIMQSRFDDIAIQAGVNDSNKRTIRFYSGDTLRMSVTNSSGVEFVDSIKVSSSGDPLIHVFNTTSNHATSGGIKFSEGSFGGAHFKIYMDGSANKLHFYSSNLSANVFTLDRASGHAFFPYNLNAQAGLDVNGTLDLVDSKMTIGGSGGTSGYVLRTDGAGNVSWVDVGGGGDVYLANTQTFTGVNTFDSHIIFKDHLTGLNSGQTYITSLSSWTTSSQQTSHDARSIADGGYTKDIIHRWVKNSNAGAYSEYEEYWYNGSSYLSIKAGSAGFEFDSKVTFGAGIDVTGDATVTGDFYLSTNNESIYFVNGSAGSQRVMFMSSGDDLYFQRGDGDDFIFRNQSSIVKLRMSDTRNTFYQPLLVEQNVEGDFLALTLKNTYGGGGIQTSVQQYFFQGHSNVNPSGKFVFQEIDASDYRTNFELYLIDSNLDEVPTLAMQVNYGGKLTTYGGAQFNGGDVTIDGGSFIFDGQTGSYGFYVTRLGSSNESLRITVDDSNVNLYAEQDEGSGTRGGFNFIMDDDGTQLPVFAVKVKSGATVFQAYNGEIRSKSKHFFESGIDVTGNIDVTGTVDGVSLDVHMRGGIMLGADRGTWVPAKGWFHRDTYDWKRTRAYVYMFDSSGEMGVRLGIPTLKYGLSLFVTAYRIHVKTADGSHYITRRYLDKISYNGSTNIRYDSANISSASSSKTSHEIHFTAVNLASFVDLELYIWGAGTGGTSLSITGVDFFVYYD